MFFSVENELIKYTNKKFRKPLTFITQQPTRFRNGHSPFNCWQRPSPTTRKDRFPTAHPTLIHSIQPISGDWRGTDRPSDELSTGSPLFAGGAAAAAVAPSPRPSHPQARAGFEALLRPSTWRQRALRLASAAAAATRGGGVASFHLARRRWRRPEGRGDGARLAPRRSRCGITPLVACCLWICLRPGSFWEQVV